MLVEVLGSINMDIVTEVAALPLPGETITAKSLAHFPGGKGANQAIAAARLGASTSMIGTVGDDAFGSELRKYLSKNRVNVDSLFTASNEATGQAYICVAESGENSIVVIPGANHVITPMDLPPHESVVNKICLTQFEIPLEVIEAHWSSRSKEHTITLLNAAPAVAEGSTLFDLADFIIVNEVELACYSGEAVQPLNPDDMADQARTLLTRDDQHVIVTIGAKGAIAVSATRWYQVESRHANVMDTTGAGDCFCGALAAALSRGDELRDAIVFANAAAAISVGRKGAGPSMPTLDQVRSANAY